MKVWDDAQIQGSSEKCEIKHQCNAILSLSHTRSVTFHFSQVVEMMDAPSVQGPGITILESLLQYSSSQAETPLSP